MPRNQQSTAQDSIQGLKSDSLTTGVAITITATVVQRGVGFLRTALFCRLLPDHQLGQWSLAFCFVLLAAPLTTLGIIGSLGRYVEYYQRRCQLHAFLRVTALTSALLATTAIAVFCVSAPWISQIVFGNGDSTHLVWAMCGALAVAILYNFLLEVFVALRRPRVGSTMELISSSVFAIVGVSLLLLGHGSEGIIVGYAAGNLVASLIALFVFRRIWPRLPSAGDRLTHRSLWAKLAPYALGLWGVNIISNLFDMTDRYMILHLSGASSLAGQAMVGQYYSSLVVPVLMVAVSALLGHLILPYLTQDWEAGNRARASSRLNFAMKLVGLMLSFGSAIVLLSAPLLFNVAFGGKYQAGFAVLPWTLSFCFWNGMAVMAYNYLYCVESTKLSCLSLALGLIANVALNALLLPCFGLLGAALATAVGSALNLALVFWFSAQRGMAFDRRVWLLSAVPLVFWTGPYFTAMCMVFLLWASLATSLVLTADEQRRLRGVVARVVRHTATRSMTAEGPVA